LNLQIIPFLPDLILLFNFYFLLFTLYPFHFVHALLVELIDEKGCLEGISNEYAYKKGFSEGIKFMVYSLVMN
jgi:hypothetical protein